MDTETKFRMLRDAIRTMHAAIRPSTHVGDGAQSVAEQYLDDIQRDMNYRQSFDNTDTDVIHRNFDF